MGEAMSDLSKTCERLRDRAAGIVLQARLAHLEGYHVEFRCNCGRSVISPTTMLLKRFGADRRLAEIVGRATCRQCGAEPDKAYLNETHNREHCHGGPPGWSVQLVPFPLLPASEQE